MPPPPPARRACVASAAICLVAVCCGQLFGGAGAAPACPVPVAAQRAAFPPAAALRATCRRVGIAAKLRGRADLRRSAQSACQGGGIAFPEALTSEVCTILQLTLY